MTDDTPTNLAQVREQVIELLAWLDRPPRTLRVETGEVTVDIAWDNDIPHQPEAAAPPAADTGTAYLRSPAVGIFHYAKEPGAAPFVTVGDQVRPKRQIGIVEAMKLMIPVEADRAGTITAVLVADGTPVEFDEPLFALADAEVSEDVRQPPDRQPR